MSDSNPINNLSEIFRHFPGIGPRQARRFVYYLLSQDRFFLENLTKQIGELKKTIQQCNDCQRFFNNSYSASQSKCKICLDSSRDPSLLMVVERDIDLDAVEKSGSYRGYYFVLGGTIPILDKDPDEKIRAKLLSDLIKNKGASLEEVIVATSAHTEGDNTADYLQVFLRDMATQNGFRISLLGRGLSTGSELEYADPDTIKNALSNRH
jgi:recombination protein RecR